MLLGARWRSETTCTQNEDLGCKQIFEVSLSGAPVSHLEARQQQMFKISNSALLGAAWLSEVRKWAAMAKKVDQMNPGKLLRPIWQTGPPNVLTEFWGACWEPLSAQNTKTESPGCFWEPLNS